MRIIKSCIFICALMNFSKADDLLESHFRVGALSSISRHSGIDGVKYVEDPYFFMLDIQYLLNMYIDSNIYLGLGVGGGVPFYSKYRQHNPTNKPTVIVTRKMLDGKHKYSYKYNLGISQNLDLSLSAAIGFRWSIFNTTALVNVHLTNTAFYNRIQNHHKGDTLIRYSGTRVSHNDLPEDARYKLGIDYEDKTYFYGFLNELSKINFHEKGLATPQTSSNIEYDASAAAWTYIIEPRLNFNIDIIAKPDFSVGVFFGYGYGIPFANKIDRDSYVMTPDIQEKDPVLIKRIDAFQGSVIESNPTFLIEKEGSVKKVSGVIGFLDKANPLNKEVAKGYVNSTIDLVNSTLGNTYHFINFGIQITI